MNEHLSIHK